MVDGLATPLKTCHAIRLVARHAVRHLKLADRHAPVGNRVAPDCQINARRRRSFATRAPTLRGRLINLGSVFPFAIPLVRTPAGQVA